MSRGGTGRTSTAPRSAAGRNRNLVLAASALALLVRAGLIAVAPLESYAPDHRAFMTWASYAYEHGPLGLYDCPASTPVVTRARDPQKAEAVVRVTFFPEGYNYGPLSTAILWFEGWLWARLDGEVLTRPVPDALAGRAASSVASSRLLETHTARFVQAVPSVLADFVLAAGVGGIAAEIAAGAAAPAAPLLAYAATLLAPPIFLDSAFWNQSDSWIAALMVWTVVALLRERLFGAGVLFGAGLMIKPQMILLAPLLGYAFLARRHQPHGSWADALALWRTAAAALATILVVAGPFMLSDAGHPDGPWRWFKRSYVHPLANPMFAGTTWNALNAWWLDYAAEGFSRAALDPATRLWGVRKDTLGALAYAIGVAIACWGCARRWGWARRSWPVCAYLVTLAAFIFPTRVHERYVYYSIPFLIALAIADRRRWGAPLAAVVLVGTFEMLAFRWLDPAVPLARVASGVLAALAVGALLYSIAIVHRGMRPAPTRPGAAPRPRSA